VKLSAITLVDYDFTRAGQQRQALTARFEQQIAPQPR
jgi:hypothetical protein